MSTRFTRTYDVQLPIVSAGMAMVAGPELVAAVCNAGGLGILGTGPMPPDHLRTLIAQVRALTSKPFGINLIVENTTFGPACTDEHVEICAEAGISPIVFFWNQPQPAWVSRLRAGGARLWMTVSSPTQARQAASAGFDALIVQSSEAGGHVRATEGMFTLLPAVRDAVGDAMILIAAGGIADGRTAAAALLLGADALCLGTRLVASDESAAHDFYKAAIVDAQSADTVITTIFGPEWPDVPMRVIRNRAVLESEQNLPGDADAVGSTLLFGQPYPMPPRSAVLPTRDTRGDTQGMCLAAGRSVQFVHSTGRAGELIREIAAAAQRLLGRP